MPQLKKNRNVDYGGMQPDLITLRRKLIR